MAVLWLYFSFITQLHHCGQNSASLKQFHGKQCANPSIVASVLNISDWLYGRNVRDPIFSTPWTLHYPLSFTFSPTGLIVDGATHTLSTKCFGERELHGQNLKITILFTISGQYLRGFLLICEAKTASCVLCPLCMQTHSSFQLL